jgi:hypothetical protein
MGVSPVDDHGVSVYLEKLPSLPISNRSLDDRQKEVEEFLNWIRAGKPTDKGTPTDRSAKIDQMLPRKKHQTPPDRARDIEGALDWTRIFSVVPADDQNVPSVCEQFPSVPVSRKPVPNFETGQARTSRQKQISHGPRERFGEWIDMGAKQRQSFEPRPLTLFRQSTCFRLHILASHQRIGKG